MEGETGGGRARPRTARSLAAEAAFKSVLAAADAELLEREWLGSLKPHRIRCAVGHEHSPRPAAIQQGQGICRSCAGRDPAQAYAAFKSSLAELGATLLERTWLGVDRPHKVRCVAGHECAPRPLNVRHGQGICRKCARNDPEQAAAEFLARLAEVGAELQEPYVSNHHRHRVLCREGHECFPTPANVSQGWGFCRTCAGQDPVVAAAAFRANVERQGGTVLGEYIRAFTAVLIRCAYGHERATRPNDVAQGHGICGACAANNPARAEAKLLARLAELGATLEGLYVNATTPVKVRCAAGHECRPRPQGILGGQGACLKCAGKEWDAFYVVTSSAGVKFGVTSGDTRPRLRAHHAAGYSTTVRLLTGLPDDVALTLERAVLATLRLARIKPVRGREYFDIDALPVVLDVVDNYPIDNQEQEVA